MKELEKLRAQIREVDQGLISLFARRLDLALKIGQMKRRSGMPIRDWSVEKEVIRRARQMAIKLQVPPDLVKDIMAKLIQESCARQEELPLAAGDRDRDQVLIVGGNGRMGQWFARFFRNQGHAVSIYDPDGHLPGFPSFDHLHRASRWASLIVLATPLESIPEVYQELIDLKPAGVMCDIASIKSGLLEIILKARESDLRVASIHPLFGPDTRVLSDKIICLCDCGDRSSLEAVEKLFRETSAKLIRLPLERHDVLISYVLGLSHIINIVFARTLSKSGFRYADLSRVASTTFLRQMATTASVVMENPNLYFEIQRANPFSAELYAQLGAVLDEITEVVTSQDGRRFVRIMEESRDYVLEESRPVAETRGEVSET